MRRIMFVDDDVQVLHALRNALRRHRQRWDMCFTAGAAGALAELKTHPCELVISDMRMPEVDGAALLRQVNLLWPTTLRVILSGYADLDAHIKALPVAHHFLYKPCDVTTLVKVIDKCLDLQVLLTDERVRRQSAPAPPHLPASLWDLAQARLDSTRLPAVLERVESACPRLVEALPEMAQLPAFETLADYIETLGIDTARALLILAHACGDVADPELKRRFRSHALLSGWLARRLAPPGRASDAVLAAFLHDYGRLLLTEEAADGISHGQLGASIVLAWGLPLAVADGVARHADVPCAAASLDLAGCVHVAAGLAREVLEEEVFGHPLDEARLGENGWSAHVRAWRAMAQEEARRCTVT